MKEKIKEVCITGGMEQAILGVCTFRVPQAVGKGKDDVARNSG